METYSLVAVSILLLIILIKGGHEYYVNMPKWFAEPPASFEVIRQQSKGAARFWIPVQSLFLISYVSALVSNWDQEPQRPLIAYAGLSYLLVIIATGTYYVKEIMAFQKIPMGINCRKGSIGGMEQLYSGTFYSFCPSSLYYWPSMKIYNNGKPYLKVF